LADTKHDKSAQAGQ